MSYLKYIALMIGIVLVMVVKTNYTKRNGTQSTEPYSQQEQLMLYTGYGLLAAALILVVLFNQNHKQDGEHWLQEKTQAFLYSAYQ